MHLPSAVVFDLDGTLVDSLEDIALAAEEALGDHGYPMPDRDRLRRMVGDGARMLVARALGLSQDDERVDPVLTTFLARYEAAPTRATRCLPGALEVIATLRRLGIPAVVCTNKTGPLARVIVQRLFGSLPCVGGGDVPELKPHPALVLAALSRVSVPPSTDAWMVGDSAQDVEAGRRAGLTTWAVLGGYGAEHRLLDAGAHQHVPDLSSLQSHLEGLATR